MYLCANRCRSSQPQEEVTGNGSFFFQGSVSACSLNPSGPNMLNWIIPFIRHAQLAFTIPHTSAQEGPNPLPLPFAERSIQMISTVINFLWSEETLSYTFGTLIYIHDVYSSLSCTFLLGSIIKWHRNCGSFSVWNDLGIFKWCRDHGRFLVYFLFLWYQYEVTSGPLSDQWFINIQFWENFYPVKWVSNEWHCFQS